MAIDWVLPDDALNAPLSMSHHQPSLLRRLLQQGIDAILRIGPTDSDMTPSSSSDVDPVREIRRIHMMLEDWIVGIRENVRPVVDALNDDFTWIGPEGEVCDGAEMISAFSARRDDAKGGVGPIRLDVDSIEPQRERYGLHLLTFEKHLTVGDFVENTTCSVWLNETDRASTGLEWLHLQETPIDDPESTASDN